MHEAEAEKEVEEVGRVTMGDEEVCPLLQKPIDQSIIEEEEAVSTLSTRPSTVRHNTSRKSLGESGYDGMHATSPYEQHELLH